MVVLALVLRIVVIAADTGYFPHNDAFEYDYNARSIAAGDGFAPSGYLAHGGPTAIRGPAYPYLLGGIYSLTDDSRTAGRLLNAVLGALTVLLTFVISTRLWGRRVGLLAAFFVAVFPPLVLMSRDLVSESLFIPLELTAVLCLLNFRRSGGALAWAAATGVALGAAVLTRNTGFVLAIPVVVGLWIARPGIGARVLAPATALLVALVLITPWLIRDAAEFGRLVPVTTSGGIAVSGTYNEASFDDASSHGAWRDPQIVPEFTHLFLEPGRNEAEVDSILRDDALSFAWQHPGYVLSTSGWNVLRLFEIEGGSVVDEMGRAVVDRGIGSETTTPERIGLALAGVLALCGLVVLVRARRRSRRDGTPPSPPSGPLFLWLVPLVMLAAAIPIAGVPRYRLPADPFILMLAAIGAAWLFDRLGPTHEAAT